VQLQDAVDVGLFRLPEGSQRLCPRGGQEGLTSAVFNAGRTVLYNRKRPGRFRGFIRKVQTVAGNLLRPKPERR
jgi:hypothetical protein